MKPILGWGYSQPHLSLLVMDYDTNTRQLTAQATEHSKLVTIQALVLIMGVSQSPAYQDIQDQHLQYFYNIYVTFRTYK